MHFGKLFDVSLYFSFMEQLSLLKKSQNCLVPQVFLWIIKSAKHQWSCVAFDPPSRSLKNGISWEKSHSVWKYMFEWQKFGFWTATIFCKCATFISGSTMIHLIPWEPTSDEDGSQRCEKAIWNGFYILSASMHTRESFLGSVIGTDTLFSAH